MFHPETKKCTIMHIFGIMCTIMHKMGFNVYYNAHYHVLNGLYILSNNCFTFYKVLGIGLG